MSQNVSTAVMQRRVEAHDSLDDFPTPTWAVRAMIKHVLQPQMVLPLRGLTASEPACNRGYLARALAEYFGHVHCSDIFNYGWPGQHAVVDYLFPGNIDPAHVTITNPPFRLAEQFITKSFEGPNWMATAVIVRSSFLEGDDRYNNLFSVRPPAIIAQHVERVIMTKGIVRDPAKEYWDEITGKMRRPASATSYSWLIWLRDKPHDGTRMMWIPKCRKAMERPGDYPEVVTP